MTSEEFNKLIEDKSETYTISIDNGNIINITITEDIDYMTLVSIADVVAENVITEDEYKPERKIPIMLYHILDKMTDCKPPQDEDGTFDMDKIFKIMKSPIGLKIEEVIFDIPTLHELDRLVDQKIDFRKQQLLSKQSPIQVTAVSKFDDAITNFANTLSKVVEELPKAIDTKNLQPFIEKVSAMKSLDEKELVKAVVKANHRSRLRDHLPKKKSKKEASVDNISTDSEE